MLYFYSNLVGTPDITPRVLGGLRKRCQQFPDQHLDSDQEQIRNASADNHHMGSEQSADKVEQYCQRRRCASSIAQLTMSLFLRTRR